MSRPRLYEEERVVAAFRLPQSLHDALKRAAAERDVSVNFLAIRALFRLMWSGCERGRLRRIDAGRLVRVILEASVSSLVVPTHLPVHRLPKLTAGEPRRRSRGDGVQHRHQLGLYGSWTTVEELHCRNSAFMSEIHNVPGGCQLSPPLSDSTAA